jgi:D-lactate dehydrogenase
MRIAFYDTKSYDRDYFGRTEGADRFEWHFHEFRLSTDTAGTAQGSQAVCVFVNDRLDRACLEALAGCDVRLVVLRCAGFNNVDVRAARSLGLAVTRVPAYSPHAVAEHAVALLLTLNRKIHRAYNRVRELNFSLSGLVGFDLHGKTVGIIGSGRIGRAAAEIVRGFGCRVLASDPAPMRDWASAHGVEYVTREDLLACGDVVSLHLPLTPETHHLVQRRDPRPHETVGLSDQRQSWKAGGHLRADPGAQGRASRRCSPGCVRGRGRTVLRGPLW